MGDVIERYLKELRRSLGSVDDCEAIIDEIRDHLTDSVAAHVDEGAASDEAERAAIARFGDPREIAAQYPAAPVALRVRRAYLYAALFSATWVLAFGLSLALSQALALVVGNAESSRIPVPPLVPALVSTTVAVAVIGGHWSLRHWIARTDRLTPPRMLLLAATGAFAGRGALTIIAGAAGYPIGPWNGPSFWIASGLVCLTIAAGYAALYRRAGPCEPLASA